MKNTSKVDYFIHTILFERHTYEEYELIKKELDEWSKYEATDEEKKKFLKSGAGEALLYVIS